MDQAISPDFMQPIRQEAVGNPPSLLSSALPPRTAIIGSGTSSSPGKALLWMAIVIYAGTVFFVSFFHERWRDEAEAWLFARDADYVTIVSRTGYAGQTALWFLLLTPLAKGGAPYWTLNALNALMAIAAIAVLILKAPFPRALKILFAFSYFLLYEYAVVARTYALTILVLFVAAVTFSKRRTFPLPFAVAVFFLFNVNVQGVFIATAFLVAFAATIFLEGRWRDRDSLLAIAVMLSGGLLAVIQLWPPGDGAIVEVVRVVSFDVIPRALSNAFFPLSPSSTAPAWIAALLILLLSIELRRSIAALIVMWVSYLFFAYLFIFKFPGSPRHHGFIFLVFIVAWWIDREENPERRSRLRPVITGLLMVSLVASVVAGLFQCYRDFRQPFSGAREMARSIRESGFAELPIASHPAPQTAAVLPYLQRDRKLWFAGIEEYGSYLLWDVKYEQGQNVSFPAAVARARKHFREAPFLLLLNVEMPQPEEKGFVLLSRTTERPFGYPDEQFWLYKRNNQ